MSTVSGIEKRLVCAGGKYAAYRTRKSLTDVGQAKQVAEIVAGPVIGLSQKSETMNH